MSASPTRLCLGLGSLLLLACGNGGGRDSSVEDVQLNMPETSGSEGGTFDGGADAAGSEGGTEGGSGSEGGTDGAVADVRPVNPDAAAPCTPTSIPLTLSEEMRVAQRSVFVAGAPGGGFVVNTSEQRATVNNVWLRRFDAMAAMQWEANVSMRTFNAVGPGGVAQDAVGWLAAYNTNAVDNNQEVFAQRFDAMGAPQGMPARLSNSPTVIDDAAQVVRTAAGHVVVWRASESTGQVRLYAASVGATGAVSAPRSLLPDNVNPAGFAAASDGANSVGVAFVGVGGSTGALHQVYVRRLDGTGTPVDAAATALTPPEVVVGDSIAAAQQGTQLAVAWLAPTMGVYLHGRTIDLSSGAMGAPVDLSPMDTPIDQPGMDRDGTGYVLAFRARLGMGPTAATVVQMLRLTATLMPRDAGALSTVTNANSGGEVRVASNGANSFVVGWSDTQASPPLTQVRVQWMRCN